MKSYFFRTFIPGILLLLAALLLVGTSFQFLVRNYLQKQTLEDLEADCNVLVRLSAAYFAEGSMSGHDFLVNLSLVSQVSDAHAVICNANGQILLCSDAPMGCKHQGLQVEQSFLQQVFSKGRIRQTGVIQGLYTEPRYVVSLPVVSGNQPVGLVILSSAISETTFFLNRLTQIYVSVSVLVILFSLVLMTYLVRQQSSPLQEMARAATAFGHGDLSSRVAIDPREPREVQALAVAFNNMAVSLEKSEQQRQEFVANVSHELKTPMTTIGGYVDGILDGTIPPEHHRHYMQIVSSETKRLSRLVRSMLDISQLQSQEGIPESKKVRFDIAECAGQVLLTFEQKITAKKLNVQVDFPEHAVYTRANQDYITQVLYNLLDNAVKFCPEGGTLGLEIREDSEKLYVSVSNDGKTIPPEELPMVFDRFHKLDKSRNRQQDGWGLGLYIVKTIVCSHGEDISVTSRDGKTAFTFSLPFIC